MEREVPTVEELRSWFAKRRAELSVRSHLNCLYIARRLETQYREERPFDAVLHKVDGEVVVGTRGTRREEHTYIIVQPSDVKDSHQSVIFDPSLDQFSEGNETEGLVELSIDDEQTLPSVVVTRGRWNEEYDTTYRYAPATLEDAVAFGGANSR